MRFRALPYLFIVGATALLEFQLTNSRIVGDDILGGILIFGIMPVIAIVSLLLQFGLWRAGIHGTAYAKTLLIVGAFVANWPLIAIVMEIEQAQIQREDRDGSTARKVQELIEHAHP